MRLYEILLEGYKEAIAAFSAEEDKGIVNQVIEKFKELVSRNQVQGNERNIDWWRKQGWEKFQTFVNDKYQQPTKNQLKKKKAIGKSITLKENDKWLIVIPLDHKASCFYGKNTEWCTARPSGHFYDQYFFDNRIILVYLIDKETGKKFAIAHAEDFDENDEEETREEEFELFDQEDTKINDNDFKEATGYLPEEVVELITTEHKNIIDQSRNDRTKLVKFVKNKLSNWRSKGTYERDEELEDLLTDSKIPDLVNQYIRAVGERHGLQDYNETLTLISIRNSSGITIQYIKNQKPLYQKEALKASSGLSIKHIRNPSDEIKREAIKMSPSVLSFIDAPKEMIVQAVKEDMFAIRYVKNPSDQLLELAVKNHPKAIRFINNPSPKLQILAVSNEPGVIRLIDSPSEQAQIAAVSKNVHALEYIKNPTEKVKIAAAKNNPTVASKLIKNPSNEVLSAIFDKNQFINKYNQAIKIEADPLDRLSNIFNVPRYYVQKYIISLNLTSNSGNR